MIWLVLYLYLLGWVITALVILATQIEEIAAGTDPVGALLAAVLLGSTWPFSAPVIIWLMVKL